MTVSVTMLDTRMGEGGSYWTAGSTYDASESFARTLVQFGWATAALPMKLAPYGAVEAEKAGVHYNNSAAANVVAFNAALARRGLVTLTTPGQYMIGGEGQGGLLIPSNTTLVCAEGVELILADATYMPLIRNANALVAGVTLGVAVMWHLTAPTFQASITYNNIHNMYPVGSWFGLLGLPGTSGNNRAYQGVWQVQSVANNQIFFHLSQQPPSGGNSQTVGVIYPVDNNIRIIGGLWNGNEVGQLGTTLNDGDPRTPIQSFRNAQNLIVSGLSYRKGAAWCFGSNNVRDVTVRDIDADGFSGGLGGTNAHDIVHLAGGHKNVLIERITADCTDNIVGMTIDVMGLPGSVTYPNYDPGDSYDTTIRDICGRETATSIVALWGNTSYLHHNVCIERVTGKAGTGSAVQIFTYAPTNMLNCNGGSLVIRDVSGAFSGPAVHIRSDGTWDRIVVDRVRNEAPVALQPLVQIDQLTTTQTIKKLDIRDVLTAVPGSTLNRTGPAVKIENSNIDDLSIEGLAGMTLAANVSLVLFSGTVGVVKRAVVEKAASASSAAGDSFLVSCENTGAGSLGALTIRDAHMIGTAGTGGVVRQTDASKVTTIRLDNATQTGGEAVSVAEAGSTAAVTTVTAA